MRKKKRKIPAPLRWLVFVLAAPIIGYWAWSYRAGVEERAVWRSGWDTRGLDFMADQAPEDIPNHRENLVFGARWFGERALPPRYDDAHQLIAKAIVRNPLDSATWLHVSRLRLFEGRWDQSRIALEHSSALEPGFTERRILAIEMWDLLGETERAIEVGLQIAQGDHSARVAVAPELIWVGMDPVDVFAQLRGEDSNGSDTLSLLAALGDLDREAMATIVDAVPANLFEESSFREGLVRRLANPLLHDHVLRLWQAESQDLTDVYTLAGGTPIRASNLDLGTPPFIAPFHLGWQPFPVSLDARADWARSDSGGRIRLQFLSNPRTNPIRWLMYRMPVPAHDQPIIVGVKVSVPEATTSTLQLLASYGGTRVSGTRRFPAHGRPDRFEVVLPPGDEARMLTLTLVRHHADPASGSNREQIVFIDGIEFGSGLAAEVAE